MRRTLARELCHMSGLLFYPIFALLLSRSTLLILIGVLTFIFLAFEFLRFRVSSINRWFFTHFKPLLREGEVSRITGASYVLIASLVAFAAFQRDIAVLALAFLAVGDSSAAIVGSRVGKTRFLGKTLEGSLACFVSCCITGFILSYVVLDIHWLTILAGSLAATFIEAIPLPINDNLSIPLFAGLIMAVTQL